MLNKSIKNDFPVLVNNPDLCYLDSGATSLKIKAVIDKMKEYYEYYGVNIHRGVYQLSHQATTEYEETRDVVARFINAKPEEIIYTKGTTNALNMVASILSKTLSSGDEIIVSELEHHSSVLPWQHIAAEKGLMLRYVDLTVDGRITLENFKATISPKTKVVAITYISNVMGYITPLKEIIQEAHKVGAVVIVDAAQAAPHIKIDVKDLDCDFLAFSAHKMLGPTGFGILYGKMRILDYLDPYEYGGDMNDDVCLFEATYRDVPYKYEAGTMPIAEAIAFKEAIKYIEKIKIDKIHEHEKALIAYAMPKLLAIKGVEVYNPTTDTGIIAFNIKGVHPHDAATLFDQNNVALRAGHHCAQLITKWLGVSGTLRASFYLYNTIEDVDRFLEAVKATVSFFERIG
ncbi:MAG: cysteine desulfurase [Bacilli bacterium]|nr:cysteine desulfurase [Bacilli bacterium]